MKAAIRIKNLNFPVVECTIKLRNHWIHCIQGIDLPKNRSSYSVLWYGFLPSCLRARNCLWSNLGIMMYNTCNSCGYLLTDYDRETAVEGTVAECLCFMFVFMFMCLFISN